jgi:hypothetical protein
MFEIVNCLVHYAWFKLYKHAYSIVTFYVGNQ